MKKLNILYLEDSAEDAEFAGRILKEAGVDFTFKLVDTQKEYEEALSRFEPDIILADHSLFQFNSSQALKVFRKKGLKIPFILVTGTVSEEFAVNILKEGADDYLLKGNLVRLPNAILTSLEKYRLEKEKQEYLDNIVVNEALMKEAERLANFGSWEANTMTGEVKWSDGVFHLFGYKPGEVKPGLDLILRHIHPDERSSYQQVIQSYLLDHDIFESEMRITDRKGHAKFVFYKIVVTRNSDEQLTRILGFIQDITEKRNLENELAEQKVYQQKLITEVTIEAQEKERNELGRELHDNINQVLASVKMLLKMAMKKEDKRNELIRNADDNVSYAIDEIRKLSRSLVAPSLGDLGLMAALQELADEFNMSNDFNVELINDTYSDGKIDKNMELMLYRIAQEQLNNIRKYGKASKTVITVQSKNDHLFFCIADNGIGFDTFQKPKGIGLKNIKSRVDFYSGKMTIISAPGNGCRLEINIPL